MAFNRRDFGIAGVTAFGVALLASAAQADSADEAAVKAAVAAYYKAYLDADGPKLEVLFSDRLSFGHSDGRIEDKKKVAGDVAAKKNIYKKFTFENETVDVVELTAVVRHRVTIDGESADGKPSSTYVGILQVWQKQGGAWRLLGRQAVPVKKA